MFSPTLSRFILASLFCSIFYNPSIAAVITSAASGAWNNPASWSPAQVPVAGDNVTISGFVITVTANAACASLNINGNNFDSPLDINAGVTLTISGNFGTNRAGGANCTLQVTGGGEIICGNLYCSPSSGGGSSRFTKLRFAGPAITTVNVSLNTQQNQDAIINNAYASQFTITGAVSTSATGANPGMPSFDVAGVVRYTGAAQTIFPNSYNTLVLGGSDIKTIPSGVVVNDLLSLEGSASLAGQNIAYQPFAGLRYAGSVAQVSGLEFPSTFSGEAGVIINNINGVTLSSSRTISGKLTLTNGILTTSNVNMLTISNTNPASISGGSTASYINGPVTIALPSNLGSGSSYSAPVGVAPNFQPLNMINPITGSGGVAVTIQAFAGDPGGVADAASISSISASEYWSLTVSGNFIGSNISLTRQTPLGLFNAIARSATVNGVYSSAGGTVSGSSILNSADIGGSPLQFFAFGVINAIVPLTMSAIKAAEQTNGVVVEWSTFTETNIIRYDIEKSIDGLSFSKVGSLPSKGNSSATTHYYWIDANAADGNNYYRIKPIDLDEEIRYSAIVKVAVGNPLADIQIYPNPVSGNIFTLQLINLPKGRYRMSISNQLGQRMAMRLIEHSGGSQSLTIQPSAHLSAGHYQLELTGDNFRLTHRIQVK